MPAEPRAFRIVQSLQTALRAITVVGGYHHDVAALAVKLDPDANAEQLVDANKLRPFCILELEPDTFTYSPQMARIDMPATVHFVNDVSDLTDDNSWLREYTRLCADVEQAIAPDMQRGGLAIDTRIMTQEYHSRGGAEVWAMVKLLIGVRRPYGAPNA